jgi:Xaa-Pro aminopeptidase
MAMNVDHPKRRREVQRELQRRKLACLVVTHPANWFYLTGFTGESGALVVSHEGATLLTDGRFTVQAKQETQGLHIELQKGALFTALGELLKRKGWKRAGYDPGQLTVAQLEAIKKAVGSKWKGTDASGVVSRLRMQKDAQELAAMRKAAILAGEALESVLPMLKPGIRESEIASEIEYQMRKGGASGASFETIVASGPRGALPHARPTGKKLRKNELVVLDLGAILAHYCSDMTRTVFLGRASRKVRGWYGAVLEAQQAAIAKVQDGVTCGEVDAAAREVLKKHHLEAFFVHSTGHGLGLEVHEEPRIARGQETRLQAGNVITIEPGVYMEGAGGIRIEDDVVVHAGRSEVLTRVKRDLIEL